MLYNTLTAYLVFKLIFAYVPVSPVANLSMRYQGRQVAFKVMISTMDFGKAAHLALIFLLLSLGGGMVVT